MSTRRAPGLSAFSRSALTQSQYATHGQTLRATQQTALAAQLSSFQSALRRFAATHATQIRADPGFRAEFARMCSAIGVDPLAGSYQRDAAGGAAAGGGGGGSFWAQLLGSSVHDFYFELAVRVVECCRATRGENGGMMEVEEVRRRVSRGRMGMGMGGGGDGGGMEEEVSTDDILRAVRSLEPLGSGFAVLELGRKQMIRSVPKELNTDQSTVLEALQVLGFVTVEMLRDNLGWEGARAMAVLSDLVSDSLVWVDEQADETEYWTPTFIHDTGG
ncbi:MAG: hypothetical protein M1821_009431 [Bathelium mastoideum]|nr:MAG: hypothetical protein M1821_009431 [Bathelium mastoideum]